MTQILGEASRGGKEYTLKQCAPMLCVHVYVAKIHSYMSLRVHIHTIDELTESNVGIVLDEILDFFVVDKFRDKFIDKMGTKARYR